MDFKSVFEKAKEKLVERQGFSGMGVISVVILILILSYLVPLGIELSSDNYQDITTSGMTTAEQLAVNASRSNTVDAYETVSETPRIAAFVAILLLFVGLAAMFGN